MNGLFVTAMEELSPCSEACGPAIPMEATHHHVPRSPYPICGCEMPYYSTTPLCPCHLAKFIA